MTAFGKRPGSDPYEWLDLVVTDGPFLSRPALKAAYSEGGLPRPDAASDSVQETFRAEFPAWEKSWTEWARSGRDSASTEKYLAQREQWIDAMLAHVLGWSQHVSREGAADLVARSLDGTVDARAYATLSVAGATHALVYVTDPTESLSAPGQDGWAASAIDRAAALLRASSGTPADRIPLAIATDGRWWAVVWTGETGTVGSGTFDGALFREEPDLRDAFWALARLQSIAGGAENRRLSSLLQASVASTEEITNALGTQVRAAVELLVQSFSESHLRELAAGRPSPLPVDGHQVYEAAVTVMMRVVFLLFAEANELLPTEQMYRDAYAISGVGDSLKRRQLESSSGDGDDPLAHTYDTWHRLLAASRAVYEGASFEDLRMPAYGGSLFDPERFPWLTASTSEGGLGLRVDDLVMSKVLRSVQWARVSAKDERQISFRDLDVEQIGYAYEGLLGYSARYADELIVGLRGPESGSEPEVPLAILRGLRQKAEGDTDAFIAALGEWVKEDQPGAKLLTAAQLKRAVGTAASSDVQSDALRKLRPVVDEGPELDDLVAFYPLLRSDLRDYPYVVPERGLLLVETQSRSTSGAHYTPRSLAEEVVEHTLEPLVFNPGPLQTSDASQWRPLSSTELLDLKVADIAAGSGAFLVAAARYLGKRLLEAWDREGIHPLDSPVHGEARAIEARREVIARCLYGADINEMAVEMCKLSLWLVSLDKGKPFSFVDDKVFCGNSLLGLTSLDQLRGLHVEPSPKRLASPGFTVDVDAAIRKATELREELASPVSENDTMRSTRAKRKLLAQLDENNAQLRTIADAVIAAGLSSGGKPGRQLDAEYEALSLALLAAYPTRGDADPSELKRITATGLTPTVETDYARWQPLHWIVELPDVMVEHGGFDAIVGNPPFLGGKKLSPAMGQNMRMWFVNQLAAGMSGNADLAAYFFLRAAALLRPSTGQFGLIATNTIAQGDTREVGLDRLAVDGLTIRRSTRSTRWPAAGANLEYAAVWSSRMPIGGEILRNADGVGCYSISTFLEPAGKNPGIPAKLRENKDLAFIGSNVNGAGFLMDPSLAAEMIASTPALAEVIAPFLGGEDLNQRQDSSASRWIVDFHDWDEPRCRTFTSAYEYIERRVKPYRAGLVKKPRLQQRWWVYESRAARLYESLRGTQEVLAITIHSRTVMPVRLRSEQVFSHGIAVFATDSFVDQAVLSSSLHQIWAVKFGSGIRKDPRYTPSDVFETFPRPSASPTLLAIGETLDETRCEIMLRRQLGLTSLYNLVNDPNISGDDDVDRMREIHREVDLAVLAAYGWDGLQLDHGFHTYRQMERYTVSPAARVELMDRLLEENHKRAVQERASADVSPASKTGRKNKPTQAEGLF